MFGLSGQLALPGAAAQIGLDGVAYSPVLTGETSEFRTRTPEGGEPLLGIGTPGFDLPDDAPPWARNLDEYERRLRELMEPDVPRRQLVIPEVMWSENERQTELFPVLRVRRPLVSSREAKCNVTRFAPLSDVGLVHTPRGTFRMTGLIQCDKYTCPVCGRRRARDVAAKLGACIERHLEQNLDGCMFMLTLAPPHKLEDGVRVTNAWLYDACAIFYRTKAWKAFSEEFAIHGRVRAYDAVHGGPNGTHAHFHIALFPERALVPLSTVARLHVEDLEGEYRRAKWQRSKDKRARANRTTNDERAEDIAFSTAWAETLMQAQATAELAASDGELMRLRDCSQGVQRLYLRERARELLPAWRESLRRAGCPRTVGSNALDLIPAAQAEAYFVKWGLAEELALSVEKDRSHLALLNLVARKLGEVSDIAADLYVEFNEAMRGRTWVTGLSDIAHRLEVNDDDADKYVERQREKRNAQLAREGEEQLPELPEVALVVRGYLWQAFLNVGHEVAFAEVKEMLARHAYDAEKVQRDLDAFLVMHVGERSAPRGLARGSPDG